MICMQVLAGVKANNIIVCIGVPHCFEFIQMIMLILFYNNVVIVIIASGVVPEGILEILCHTEHAHALTIIIIIK